MTDFPYENFPYRLEIKKEKRICWFECEEHLKNYVKRGKFKKTEIIITKNGKRSKVNSGITTN